MVNPTGLEPVTSSMSMKRSNQLSYRFRLTTEDYSKLVTTSGGGVFVAHQIFNSTFGL